MPKLPGALGVLGFWGAGVVTGLLGMQRVLEVPMVKVCRGTRYAGFPWHAGGPRVLGKVLGMVGILKVWMGWMLRALGGAGWTHQQPCAINRRALRCPSRGCCANTCPGPRTASGWWAPRPCTGSVLALPAFTWHRLPCCSMCAPALTAEHSSTTGKDGPWGLPWGGAVRALSY